MDVHFSHLNFQTTPGRAAGAGTQNNESHAIIQTSTKRLSGICFVYLHNIHSKRLCEETILCHAVIQILSGALWEGTILQSCSRRSIKPAPRLLSVEMVSTTSKCKQSSLLYFLIRKTSIIPAFYFSRAISI